MTITIALVAAGGWIATRHFGRTSPVPTCTVGAYILEVPQAANAATIAAVGKRMGLADHAVTVALAAALQESKLRNLDHGDLDSVGLFQQRPSQGWGTRTNLLVPRLAASAFYRALGQIDGWATMAVTDAAQQVQRSAAPSAYAQWEGEARALAVALTGEAPAGVSCRFAMPSTVADSTPVAAAMAAELGPPTVGTPLDPARGWTVASWLVTHASTYRVASVAFLNSLWTPGSGRWVPRQPTVSQVEFRVA